MLEKSCNEFIDQLASNAPVPGGGSASALTAAIGMALGSMVGELTSGNKKFSEYETEVSELLFRSSELIRRFKELTLMDMEAFERLNKALKLPRSTEEEKASRTEAVQTALVGAAEAPLLIVEECVKALKILDSYSLIGNNFVISDAGTGTALCEAALKGARLNVLVNLKLMKDTEQRDSMKQRLDAASETGRHLAKLTYERVEQICEDY
ncbi:MAG: cyclodeaminase/cyclohydrolase family protein [Clostridia bacterium]|nr:cyclodeaminase/cyclohydrolase family protein [Clostridia bacterium]